MNSSEYITKYNLLQSRSFNTSLFIEDLKIEFTGLLNQCKGDKSFAGFQQCVRIIRQKWDAINRKTGNVLEIKLWNYFYASYIIVKKKEFFPEQCEREKQKKEEYRQREEDRRNRYQQYNRESFKTILDYLLYGLLNDGSSELKKHLDILDLNESASIEDVKDQYRKLCKIYHPDKGGDSTKFNTITESKDMCIRLLSKRIYHT